MIQELKAEDYISLMRFLSAFSSLSRERGRSLLFRGHADACWPLETTLDRERKYGGNKERSDYFDALIREFRREAFRIVPDPMMLADGIPFELMARHHGIPSPFLDWTESPYVSAFFAFEGAGTAGVENVAIWLFNRLNYQPIDDEIELIDDFELIRYNRRALQQRGQFMRVRTIQKTVVDLLGDSLMKLVIPTAIRGKTLSDLDEMGINAATLFSDLDGAARTARSRLALYGEMTQ